MRSLAGLHQPAAGVWRLHAAAALAGAAAVADGKAAIQRAGQRHSWYVKWCHFKETRRRFQAMLDIISVRWDEHSCVTPLPLLRGNG